MIISRYYQNLNTVGKVKSGIILFGCLLNIIIPTNTGLVHWSPGSILMPLIFGSIIIPLIAKFNAVFLKSEISSPKWNENPLNLRKPLVMFDFFAFLFITTGLGMLLGTFIKFQLINWLALNVISYGPGILIGIFLSLKWVNNK